MKINFDAIEARLKTLVESSTQLVTGRQNQRAFPAQLVTAVEAYLKEEEISELDEFPKTLILQVSPISYTEWRTFPVSETMQNLLQDAGLTGEFFPLIEICVNDDFLADEILIRNGFASSTRLDKTASMPALSPVEENFLNDTIPANAFLIVNGLDTILLNLAVFNIGRRLENDLVIEDPRISREHAQIRAVKGKYVLFDLNSSGGTFVNSIRISQQPLFPGDVISLAGIPLVYGEDTPPPFFDTGQMEPFDNSEKPGEKT